MLRRLEEIKVTEFTSLEEGKALNVTIMFDSISAQLD